MVLWYSFVCFFKSVKSLCHSFQQCGRLPYLDWRWREHLCFNTLSSHLLYVHSDFDEEDVTDPFNSFNQSEQRSPYMDPDRGDKRLHPVIFIISFPQLHPPTPQPDFCSSGIYASMHFGRWNASSHPAAIWVWRLLHARAMTVPGNARRTSAHTCYRELVALRVHQSLSYAITTTIHMTTPLLLPLS